MQACASPPGNGCSLGDGHELVIVQLTSSMFLYGYCRRPEALYTYLALGSTATLILRVVTYPRAVVTARP